MTSNLGSELIQELSAQGAHDAIKTRVMDVVGQHFRPEFLNRVDETVVFHPLAMDHLQEIAGLQLGLLQTRVAEQDLRLDVSSEALAFICEAGFDPVYGARPLRRAIQQHLENPLAQDLLAGKFMPGATVHVVLKDGRIAFEASQAAAA